MGSNTKVSKKKKSIDKLKKELIKNDEILKKNTEKPRIQIQRRMIEGGMPDSAMYDNLLEKMKTDVEEIQIKIDSGYKVINPLYQFQTNERWIEIQLDSVKKSIKVMKENVKLIEENVERVKKEVTEQTARIKERRIHIIEELGKLGEDVSELKNSSPNYIG